MAVVKVDAVPLAMIRIHDPICPTKGLSNHFFDFPPYRRLIDRSSIDQIPLLFTAMLKFCCIHCARPIEVPDHMAGIKVTCPACEWEVTARAIAPDAESPHSLDGPQDEPPQKQRGFWLTRPVNATLLSAALFLASVLSGSNSPIDRLGLTRSAFEETIVQAGGAFLGLAFLSFMVVFFLLGLYLPSGAKFGDLLSRGYSIMIIIVTLICLIASLNMRTSGST
ncbi:hypothetical protein WJU23_14455 [Prosthecobacter sp. SYSU 5D2]|uniref:hypothetical protein n=1 Tax=Prosthecobacter sp. SYSU 5D2 TaxID=3134134 RepID=UPI0031FF3254